MARLREQSGDDGFSLVEIMAAMLVFAVVAVASLALVMTSMSATALARTDAVAKNLNQELLESMRNLPYFVHANVSTVPDLLDTYYTTTASPATATDTSGFVAAAGARDTSKGDPAAGPFYRRVLGPPAGYAGFTRRVTAQFMRDGTTVIASPVFSSTATDATGLPPSSTISVRVTIVWTSGSNGQQFTVESQITDAAVNTPLVTLQGRMSLVRFTGLLPDSRELVAEAGVLNLDGSLSATTVASAVVQSGHATVANGGRVDGAAGTLAAPPTASVSVPPVGPQTLVDGAELASFSGSNVAGLGVSTDGGRPAAGTATTPVAAVLNGVGLGGDYFRATNLPSDNTRLGLLAGPVVRAGSSTCGSSCEAVKATGTLLTTGGASHSATATLGGVVEGTIALLPTTTSPEGLVKLTLSNVSVVCRSDAAAIPRGSVAVDYSGTVSHRTYDPAVGYGYSAPVAISSANSTDPLAAIDLQTLVGEDSSGAALRLSDYIQSWSSLTATAVTGATVIAANGTAASIGVPGVFTFTSKPLRSDLLSTVGLQLGAASCTASDIR